jgi:hypothetical protein
MAAYNRHSKSPHLSVDMFLKLIRTLPPAKISEIPVDKLPANIPPNIGEKAPLASRGAVENLLLAASSFHLSRHLKDQDTYGEKVVDALDRAHLTGDVASIRVFKNKVLNLVNMLQKHQRGKTKVEIALLAKNIAHINDLLIDVRSEQAAIGKIIEMLENTTPANDEDTQRFAEAKEQLGSQVHKIDQLLGEYYILRVKIMAHSIWEKRRQVEFQENEIASLQKEIDTLRQQLEASQSVWRRTLQRHKTKEEYITLQARITGLVQEINTKEIVIVESDLTSWLDAIVDVSLNAYAHARVAGPARDARIALYYLLDKFCRIQEASALQIAQNPFLQVNPEKAIKFVLMSEQFILDYFANKKKDTTAWLSGAAKVKIEDLDRLEKDILSELRRTIKIHRKHR